MSGRRGLWALLGVAAAVSICFGLIADSRAAVVLALGSFLAFLTVDPDTTSPSPCVALIVVLVVGGLWLAGVSPIGIYLSAAAVLNIWLGVREFRRRHRAARST